MVDLTLRSKCVSALLLREDVLFTLQMRPLWLKLVRMGARLDVVAPVYNIKWSRKLPTEIDYEQLDTFFTFAHFAALFRDYDLLNAAIAHRADLDVRSYLFGSPLHIACDKGDKKMAEILLRNGAHRDPVAFVCLATVISLCDCLFIRTNACQHTLLSMPTAGKFTSD